MPTCFVDMILNHIYVHNTGRFRLVLRHEFLTKKYNGHGGYLNNFGGFEVISPLLINVQQDGKVDVEFLLPREHKGI